MAILSGLVLPILTLAIGIYMSHAYTPRYSLPVVVPVAVTAALMFRAFSGALWVGSALLIAVVALGISNAFLSTRNAARDTTEFYTRLNTTADLERAWTGAADPHLYLQDTAQFLPLYFYASPELRQRLMLVQSVAFEWKWNHSAASGLSARNLHYSTSLSVASWEHVSQNQEPLLLLTYQAGSDWLLREIPADRASIQIVGKALGGQLLRITCAGLCPATTPAASTVPRKYTETP